MNGGGAHRLDHAAATGKSRQEPCRRPRLTTVPLAIVLAVLALHGRASTCQPTDDVLRATLAQRFSPQIQLPKLSDKAVPMDDQVRVGLYFPTDLALRNLELYGVRLSESMYQELSSANAVFENEKFFYMAPSRIAISTEGLPSLNTTVADYIKVDLASPFADRLTEIVRNLFPQTKVHFGKAGADPEELRFMVDMVPVVIERPHPIRAIAYLRVLLIVTILDAAGNQIDDMNPISFTPIHGLHLSENSAWRGYGSKALLSAFDELVKDLRQSQPLRTALKRLAQPRALPAGLAVSAHFDDTKALLPNGRLDAGEEAQLLIEVVNQGPGPAFNVAVQAGCDQSQVTVSGDGAVGNLAPGEKKQIALRVAGHLDLPTTMLRLRIETAEKRGYGSQPLLLELPANRLVSPRLEIVDITLDDRTGRAKGDGDGQPSNGETIEAIVRVRNAGPGDAVGVAVTMASPKVAAEILDSKAILPRIAADRVEEARLLFRLPVGLEASDLPLSFKAVEARGPQVGSADRDQSWKIRTKRPNLELTYRLYDGNSPGSSGNGDGRVNNGERIEVAVTPANRGDLPARGVRLAVASDDPNLTPIPAVLEVGDLPARAEGSAQRFVFDVARGYGLDRPEADLHFTLTVSQRDFPPRRDPIAFGFRAVSPDLSLDAGPLALQRGKAGDLVLRLRNQGSLPAEDVAVEISTDSPGVDLLDERGAPVRSRKIAVGTLDPHTSAPQRSVPVNVRRNAALGAAPLRISVTQKDFPTVLHHGAVAVSEEPAMVIAAAPAAEAAPERSPAPTAAVPATISFLRNTPGEHLLAEAAILRFEVQSPAELSEVRVTQNDRRLALDGERRSSTVAGDLKAMQFELPVQLEDGENRFEVVTVTRQGLRSARSLSLFRDREVGRLWVVAIGISKYQDPAIPALGYADADARAIYEYFRDTFGLPANQVFLRTNEQATLREIKSLLGTKLANQANDSKDTVILYLAGHGMRDRLSGSLDADGLSKYFLPYDSSRTDLYSTALDMDEVTNILRRLTPERVVVLFDSCFSGAAGGRSPYEPQLAGERALISGEFLDRMAHAGRGRVVLTASGPGESAQERSDLGHGLFTYYLLEGLHGAADAKGDGNIDVNELYAYVSEKVSRATDGKQNPKLKAPDLVGQILIGRANVRHRS